MSDKKTADMKAYQADYRKKNPKSKEEQSAYMKGYIKNAESLTPDLATKPIMLLSRHARDAIVLILPSSSAAPTFANTIAPGGKTKAPSSAAVASLTVSSTIGRQPSESALLSALTL
jgi:hypothetical protein